ncbi:A disintegrin and metalloproteinase with thrombospondin motifs 13 [Astyanax mexicanus]|uniref:A disintegrin and metalloproteinase with thrombospondin motifs 13 n=1 Tax=Astyanax mexicanus TaxID=7994 RepID=A0A8T2LLU5_ASTMX|nr:A disintegrin and metalloproteinase with thrombospondin motifs 13 [Astyanax mexicanus]
MAWLVSLFLASVLVDTVLLTSEFSLEKDFLQSLQHQDLLYYFNTNSMTSVPDLQLVWVNCSSRRPWQCSFQAQGEQFQLGQLTKDQLFFCPSSLEFTVNSTLSIIKRRENTCCERLYLQKPENTQTLLSVCHGKLQGLLLFQPGKRKMSIQPLLQKHSDHLRNSVDHIAGVPHLMLTHPSPVVKTHLKQSQSHHRIQRSFLGTEVSHLELLVVVGPDVHDVHKQDTERYILTNLNIASELLRDVTLGANMRVHLVRMIILTEAEPEIQISDNITSSLRSVCEWGHKVNPSNDTDPLHADLLLYITRFDLVLPSGNKLVRGVTQLGGVCSSQWNCVITEDTGFDLGITIAHEIGHSFGINHDSIANTCSGSGFIMASDGGYNSVDLTWSQCSRSQLLDFYSAGKAECVKDVPVVGGSQQQWRPGLYYGVDDQCRIAFGRTATACSFNSNDMATCRVLSCHIIPGDRSSCTRLLVPLLDGTECGPNQWCLKGRCVSPSKLSSSMVVHGSWSSWYDFSPCSRTCGGGITFRKRECNNPRPAFGGRECEGDGIEAELCHRQSCESTQFEFMAQQCSDTDHQPLLVSPHSDTVYSWIPAVGFSSGDAQCKLVCRSREQEFMVSRGSQFIDGTRCEPDDPVPTGMVTACLRGKCQEFGCDGVLHSRKVEDLCGVCGGNSSTCQLISGSYTGGEAQEYVTFLILPVNASQVHVINWKPVFTHLAVLVNGEYIVSGHGDIALNTTHPSPLEESHMIYRLYLTSDLLPQTEELTLSGPITDKIHIQVYRKYGKEYGDVTSPNITYQYYMRDNIPMKKGAEGQWSTIISPCSVMCGTGIQKVTQECVDMNTQEHLEEQLCGSSPPSPTRLQPCYLPDCPASWVLGEFGPCSTPCGSGEWVRSVACLQKQGTETVTLPDSECSQIKPPVTETCNTHLCPARWQVSEPGECSAVCGPGEAPRTVLCVRNHRGADVEVDDSLCPLPKPSEHVTCVVDVCPIGWETQKQNHGSGSLSLMPRSRMKPVYVWSPVIGHCTKTCGNGTQQIWFSCVDHQSRLDVPEFLCDRFSKPELYTQPCAQSPCPVMWRYMQGECSVSCGGGVARRVLYCSQQETEAMEVLLADSACLHVPRPLEVVVCNTEACPTRWQAGEQGSCSVSCGLGVALRRVWCSQFNGGVETEVEEERCDVGKKPPLEVPCFPQACSFHWAMQEWSECSVSCGGYGIQSRTVSCRGPSSPLPVSPILCVHLPKPITIQACFSSDCSTPVSPTQELSTVPTQAPVIRSRHRAWKIDLGKKRKPTTAAGTAISKLTSEVLPTVPVLESTTLPTQPAQLTQSSICGQLFLQDSGTIDLQNVTERRCFIAIGRPLDEVIQIKIESSSLNCRHRENLALYERLSLRRFCEKMTGKLVTSRSNVLLVRQSRVSPGNGVLLSFRSEKNPKKTHHEDCDVQLFSPSGLIENPVRNSSSSTFSSQSCRVFIDAPPALRINIRALSVFNTSSSDSTYVLMRDVDSVKTTVFKGTQLFQWSSTGSRAEVEFHGEYQHKKGTFRAEYSYVKPEEAKLI